MKKILLLFSFITLLFQLSAGGLKNEIKIGEYISSDGTFSITTGTYMGVKYISIDIYPKENNTCIWVHEPYLDDFKNSLLQLSNKFSEWILTAKNNNVIDIDNKEFPIEIPNYHTYVYWFSANEWRSSAFGKYNGFLYKPLKPTFNIINGVPFCNISLNVTAANNKYLSQIVYVAFSNPQQIINLFNQLDLNKIKEKIEFNKSKEDIFK